MPKNGSKIDIMRSRIALWFLVGSLSLMSIYVLSNSCMGVPTPTGCPIGITTNPSMGASIYIQYKDNNVYGDYFIEGTLTEPTPDVFVPCDHCYSIWVRKPDMVYSPKNYPDDWHLSSDRTKIEGCPKQNGKTAVHFSGDEIAAGISVTKSPSVPMGCPGMIVPFTITITNTATQSSSYVGAPLASFTIEDALPTGLIYDTSTPAWTLVSGNKYKCIIDRSSNPLLPGQSFQIILNAKLTDAAVGNTITNTVVASGSTSFSTIVTDSDNTATITGIKIPVATIDYQVN